ncbi:MAG: hypothetical protein KC423_16030 [Anaerolineales bacterium]|nr:hypothetical protein [Anaerolineales bacterium]MCB9432365.1 hypothetical protein [Ardenticatenaceae bacterium]
MSRVININNPSKVRNYHRRTIAEILRHLMGKTAVDAEATDMAATLVYALRGIEESVEQTAKAWEKRGYWMKSERFLRDWMWVRETAVNIEDVIRHEAWDLFPELMADLLSHFSDIELKSMTRKSDTWDGAFAKLMAEPPTELPW